MLSGRFDQENACTSIFSSQEVYNVNSLGILLCRAALNQLPRRTSPCSHTPAPERTTPMTYPPETPSSSYGSNPTTSYPPPEVTPTYSDGTSAYEAASGADNGADSSTTDVAKEHAAQVGGTAAQAGQQVAEVTKEQVANVAEQTKAEAKNLLNQTREELSSQAGNQQQRAAGGLRSLGSELQSMAAGNSAGDGPAAQVARQAADRINTAAGWLENRDPGQVLTEVQRFARQRPGAFLALAAVAGLAAGRLTRGLTADSSSTSSAGQTSTYQSGPGLESSAYPSPAQPDTGWQTPGTAPDPATAYGSDYPPAQAYDTPAQPYDTPAQPYDAPAPPPSAWTQEPAPPVSGSEYYDPGTGTVRG